MNARTAAVTEPGERLHRSQVLLLALVSGIAVASLYYLQPLLDVIGRQFDQPSDRTSLLVTAAQAGYVIGLATIVPLGDKVDRRRLLTSVLFASALTLAVAAAATTFWMLLAAMVAVGATASAAMIAVPYAAALAHPGERSRVVGSVMSGLLFGILLARTVAGAVAELTSWRVVLLVAAIVTVLLATLVRASLAGDVDTKEALPYHRVLSSIAAVVREHTALRARMLLGALSMFSFSAMWTSIAFMLTNRYGYSEATIGVFGLVGAAGASGAPLAGRLSDRGRGAWVTTGAWIALISGWLLLWWGGNSLTALVLGLLVFDCAAQINQVSNQGRIYQLPAELRGRVTTAYMVSFFVGGVAGSIFSAAVFAAAGWPALCAAGAASAAVGLAAWAGFARRGW